MADSKLAAIYAALREATPRNGDADDRRLAEGAETDFWEALKAVVLEPKIQALYLMSEEIAAVMDGKLDKETFAEQVIAARIAAGHLQDVIDRVELTHQTVTNAGRTKE